MTTHAAKCAACKCDLELFPDAKPEPRAVCPQCGNGDTLDNVTREVGEYVKEQMAQAVHNRNRPMGGCETKPEGAPEHGTRNRAVWFRR